MAGRNREFQHLYDMLMRMAALVEASIGLAIRSLVERDSELARKVIEDDCEINEFDVMIEEECIKLIALTQPMASDLRFLATTLKVTSDLERIGDQSVNIAERAIGLNTEPQLKPYVDIPMMARIAGGMVRDAIEALVRHDKKLAMDVIYRDAEIDDLNEGVFEELVSIMKRDADTISRATQITYVSKYIERIGDHSTNIAEMVIFMVEGRIIRHKKCTDKKAGKEPPRFRE